MNLMSELGCNKPVGPYGKAHPVIDTSEFSERIVNIAAIGNGDALACYGEVGADIEAAIAARGAQTVVASTTVGTGLGPVLPPWNDSRVDAVLWNANEVAHVDLAGMLAGLRCRLAIGGRLVMWRCADTCKAKAASSEPIQQLFNANGFTSVIVGRLWWNACNAVVATGVLGKRTKG